MSARSNDPPIDPTANVRALSEASNRRQDDLREMQIRLTDEKVKRAELKADHAQEIADLHARYDQMIREAESARLDAIRQVDVIAINTAADRADAAIKTLAATTTTTADALRAMVASTATTVATQLDTVVRTINDRLSSLEQNMHESAGRGRGASSSRDLIAWGVGILGTIVALFFAFR